MYLIDTDILSNLARRAPSAVLISRMAAVPAAQQFTSSITVGELAYGAIRLGPDGGALLESIKTRLLANLTILPFDAEDAWVYGKLRAGLERTGRPIGDSDMRIAAMALARGMTVVTANVRDFTRIADLNVEDWLRP
jgi:tRNA(fMet)-specific endonuclease VapC